MNKQLVMRMKKELELLERDPPPGIMCWPVDDIMNKLSARIKGPKETPYENGIFQVDVQIPERYPFEPPKAQFITPIYHPNIDNQGRICLDILKMPPKGSWKPSLNISTMLTSLLVLMSEPNPDDPLLVEVAKEYCENRSIFLKKARKWTLSYACENNEFQVENNSNASLSPSPQLDSSFGGNLHSLPISPETSCSNAQDSCSPGKRSLVDLLKKRPRNELNDTSVSPDKTTCIVKKPKTFSLTTKRKLTSGSSVVEADSLLSKDLALSSSAEETKKEGAKVAQELKPHCNVKIECTVIASDSSEDDKPSTVTDSSTSQIQSKPQLFENCSDFEENLAIAKTKPMNSVRISRGQVSGLDEKNEPTQQMSKLAPEINNSKFALKNQTAQHTDTFEVIELSDSSEEENITRHTDKTECTVDIKSNTLTADVIENISTDRSLNSDVEFKYGTSLTERVETTSSYFRPITLKNEMSASSLNSNAKQPPKNKRSLLKLKSKLGKTPNIV